MVLRIPSVFTAPTFFPSKTNISCSKMHRNYLATTLSVQEGGKWVSRDWITLFFFFLFKIVLIYLRERENASTSRAKAEFGKGDSPLGRESYARTLGS